MRKVLSASSFNSTIETKKWLQCIWLGGGTVWIAAFAWHGNTTYIKKICKYRAQCQETRFV